MRNTHSLSFVAGFLVFAVWNNLDYIQVVFGFLEIVAGCLDARNRLNLVNIDYCYVVRMFYPKPLTVLESLNFSSIPEDK